MTVSPWRRLRLSIIRLAHHSPTKPGGMRTYSVAPQLLPGSASCPGWTYPSPPSVLVAVPFYPAVPLASFTDVSAVRRTPDLDRRLRAGSVHAPVSPLSMLGRGTWEAERERPPDPRSTWPTPCRRNGRGLRVTPARLPYVHRPPRSYPVFLPVTPVAVTLCPSQRPYPAETV